MAVLKPISHGIKLTALDKGRMAARNMMTRRVPHAPIKTAEAIWYSKIAFLFSNISQLSIKVIALFIFCMIPIFYNWDTDEHGFHRYAIFSAIVPKEALIV
jgi:hypothetical protein